MTQDEKNQLSIEIVKEVHKQINRTVREIMERLCGAAIIIAICIGIWLHPDLWGATALLMACWFAIVGIVHIVLIVRRRIFLRRT